MRRPLLHPHKLILLALLLGKLVLEIAVLKDGFISLTADEYSRTLSAASWAQDPEFISHGHWLPFHYYVLGTGLFLHRDLFMTPRIITLGFSLISLLALYSVSRRLFNAQTALLTVALVASNPWHVWLSATPLSEMPYIASILTFMAFLMAYDQGKRNGALWAAALCLAFANGLRYESWLFSATFSAFLVVDTVRHTSRSNNRPLFVGTRLLVLALVWAFPVMWVLGNYLHSGDALYVLHTNYGYPARWYKHAKHLGHVEILMTIAPIMFPLSMLGILVSVVRREWAKLWPYLPLATIPLLMFVLGTLPTPGIRAVHANPYRYFAVIPFVLAPYGAYLFVNLGAIATHRWRSAVTGLVYLTIAWILLLDLSRAFHYSNRMSRDALEAGRELRRVWATSPIGANQSTFVELKYWDFLAVEVGSNDPSRIVFDRTPDKRRDSHSILLGSFPDVICHLRKKDISYVVTASDETSRILEESLHALRTVGGYRIYDPRPVYRRVECQRAV